MLDLYINCIYLLQGGIAVDAIRSHRERERGKERRKEKKESWVLALFASALGLT